MGERRAVYRVLLVQPERKRPPVRPRIDGYSGCAMGDMD
jgi:hypothetical protein